MTQIERAVRIVNDLRDFYLRIPKIAQPSDSKRENLESGDVKQNRDQSRPKAGRNT
ncbi:MAG TPA: hypothetical protein PL033_00585 [Candidatus Brocadiia bacterium]|nr:hypothetical protein [Candidatus Brocadiia bacterium]